ncbi:hypothetical protein GCM10023187_10540 [Nibrella viscosa]|uniref:Uncharacterized protein n=1 Tax=Nibrella viscosa TaxID=1084524 RepID=A0ABP8K109_9BACT
MLLELNDEIITRTGLSDDQLRLELAVQLYATGKLTMAQARRLTNLHRIAFEEELGQRGLWPNYTEEDLRQDVATLEKQGALRFGRSVS